MSKTICVGVAQFAVVVRPDKIETQALGSCVGVVLYDDISGVAGLLHAMLPDIGDATKKSHSNFPKFVNSGIESLLEQMIKKGAKKVSIKAKIIGGANMFPEIARATSHIGQKNIESARETLANWGVKVVSEDVGGNVGRSVCFDTVTNVLKVRTVFGKEKEV